MTMLEKIARALAAHDGIEICADASYAMSTYSPKARAALEAMLDPDKGMINAGINAAEEVEDWTQDSYTSYRVDSASDMPRPVFIAMIRHALENEK